jgi:hypothetical protein
VNGRAMKMHLPNTFSPKTFRKRIMSTNEDLTASGRWGHWIGSRLRDYRSMENRFTTWLACEGVQVTVITALKWLIRSTFALLLACASLVVLAFFVIAFLAKRSVARANTAPEEWAVGDHDKHRKSPFYDPINYTDPDDPRFRD